MKPAPREVDAEVRSAAAAAAGAERIKVVSRQKRLPALERVDCGHRPAGLARQRHLRKVQLLRSELLENTGAGRRGRSWTPTRPARWAVMQALADEADEEEIASLASGQRRGGRDREETATRRRRGKEITTRTSVPIPVAAPDGRTGSAGSSRADVGSAGRPVAGRLIKFGSWSFGW